MRIAYSRLFFSIFVFAALFGALHFIPDAHAQSVGSTDPLTVDIAPQYPTPYQTITITPSSSTFDIASAAISVKVNGSAYYQGSGGSDITLQLAGPGTVTTISVTATSDGQSYTKSVSVRPASVALVVEPDSTTHAFYAGAGLVPSEGRVRLVAVPDLRTSAGKQLDPSTLTYSWRLGDQNLDADSGIGKTVLDALAPQRYRDADVSVTVSSADGSVIAQASTTISPVDPITRIYENDPLLGPLFDTALSNTITMTDAEDTYRGVAYYFSGLPALTWSVNGSPNGSDPDLTVRSTGAGTGSAVLNFAANNSDSTLSADSTVSINFGQPSTGLFGL